MCIIKVGFTNSKIVVLRFSEFRTMRNHLSEILMLNDIQITSDYMSIWVVLKRRVGAVTSQRVPTENSSIFRLLTKESMLLTSATFLIEKRS
jgi:hypothetical protein